MARKKETTAELIDDMVEQVPQRVTQAENPTPIFGSPEWQDHILSLLQENELIDGKPTTAGLRRIFPRVMGPVLFMGPIQVTAPNLDNNHRATVLYEIRYRDLREDNPEFALLTIREAADASYHSDDEYGKHPTAVASTRSEGRCYRKGMLLNVVVAEEVTEGLTIESLQRDSKIGNHQINAIASLCKKDNINIHKFIKKSGFNSLQEITSSRATNALEKLNQWHNNPDDIPKDIIGFDPDWEKKEKAK